MDTYEYPLGVQFNALTPERAAARVFGGRASDYLATTHWNRHGGTFYLEVITADGEYVGEIPIVSR
jgi:hypothetical protein